MKQAIEWTQGMIDYLLENQDKSSDEIGMHLGLSHSTISLKYRELGIVRSNHKVRYEWTPERDAYLKEHYPDEAACDVAEHLGTSYGVIKKRADLLGIRKSESFSTYQFHNRWVKDYKHSIRKVA